eukprot:COSAG04_NODE_27374_length_283_cov_2.141304_1_plen_22_part_01
MPIFAAATQPAQVAKVPRYLMS